MMKKHPCFPLVVRDRYFPTNPSILPWEGGYLFNVRMVGQEESHFYSYNRLYRITEDFEVLWSQRLDHLSKEPNAHYRGLEDLRLFLHRGEVMFLASEPYGGEELRIRICIGLLSVHEEGAMLLWACPIDSPLSALQEKNWLPLSEDGEIVVQYKCGLFGRLNISSFDSFPPKESLKISLEEIETTPSGLRGGALLPIPPEWGDKGYLGILHSMRAGVYHHCLYHLNEKKKLVEISPMFSFSGERIEFVLSFVFQGTNILIPYGIMDRRFEVVSLTREFVMNLLKGESP